MMNWIVKHKWDFVYGVVIVLLLIPSTRTFIQRLISFSPGIEEVHERPVLSADNWQIEDYSNQTYYRFGELEGEVVLVNFWATWCPPCRAELPYLQDLYDQYNKKMKFLFLSNESPETIKTFFEEEGYDLPISYSRSELPVHFTKSNAIPQTYLIDRKGRIAVEKKGSARWNSSSFKESLDAILEDD